MNVEHENMNEDDLTPLLELPNYHLHAHSTSASVGKSNNSSHAQTVLIYNLFLYSPGIIYDGRS